MDAKAAQQVAAHEEGGVARSTANGDIGTGHAPPLQVSLVILFHFHIRSTIRSDKKVKGQDITIHYCCCGRGSGHIVPVIALNGLYNGLNIYIYIYLRTHMYI